MATVRLALELLLLNVLPENHINDIVVGNRFQCAFQCMYEVSCMSVVYNTVSGSCFMYNHTIVANTTGTTDGNLLMFNTDRDTTPGGEGEAVRVCLVASGYVFNEGLDFCFKIHSELKSNPDADVACKHEGGTGLAKVDTSEKLEVFMGIIPLNQYTHVNGYLVGSEWVFPADTNPQTTPYIEWSPGQPNGASINQDCLAVDSTGLHDAFCDSGATFPFICEM